MGLKKYDSQQLGIVLGLIGPLVGFVVYGLLWSVYFKRSFYYFYRAVFVEIPEFRSSILTLSLLFNLIPFFYFIRSKRYQSGRGVLFAVFIYIPVVLYFRFFN
jgi:hypothetical protein